MSQSLSAEAAPDPPPLAGQIVPGGGDYHIVPLELTGAETDRSPDIPAVTLIWLVIERSYNNDW